MKNNYIIDGDIVRIELKRRKGPSLWTLIDLADLPKANSWAGSWCAHYNKRLDGFYVDNGSGVMFHRFLLNVTDPQLRVDHWDHDTLNNRRLNIKPVSAQINNINQRLAKNNKSGFRGVCWASEKQCWKAYARYNSHQFNLGYTETPEDAYELVKDFWRETGYLEEFLQGVAA